MRQQNVRRGHRFGGQLVLVGLPILWLLSVSVQGAGAWWIKAHGVIAEAACSCLPDDVPAFFRAAGKALNHLAGDPDRFKNREARFLKLTESPEHFIDLENYEGRDWPEDRFQAVELLRKLNQEPDKSGLLPYALMDQFDKLTVAFNDYRKEPTNEAVRMKCLVYAGLLSHYTGDTCMPLHTTRDYDGRKGLDGEMKQKGIHAKIDGFPEKFGFTAEEVARELKSKAVEDVWGYVKETILESRTHIERCYELDLAGAFDRPTTESRAFIMRRCQAAAQFTMDMWYNAWRRSEKLPPPF
jgi:hypothetical protein